MFQGAQFPQGNSPLTPGEYLETFAEEGHLSTFTKHLGLKRIFISASAVLNAPGFESKELSEINLQVHPLHSLNPNDIPANLKLCKAADPRLSSFPYLGDSTFVTNWKSYLRREFSIPEDSRVETYDTVTTTVYVKNLEGMLRFYAVLWQQPSMLGRVKKYMVARELAHIQARKLAPSRLSSWDDLLFGRRNLAGRITFANDLGNIATYSGFILMVGVVIFYFNQSVGTILLAFTVASIFFVALTAFSLLNLYCARRQEKKADRKAVEITGDVEAATLFFKALEASQRESSFKIVRWISAPFEWLIGDKSLEDRVTYLK